MKIKNKIVSTAVSLSVATIIYIVLFNHLASNNIISKLLTGGNQATKFELSLCLLFIALRFFLIVLLPGVLLAMTGSLLIGHSKLP